MKYFYQLTGIIILLAIFYMKVGGNQPQKNIQETDTMDPLVEKCCYDIKLWSNQFNRALCFSSICPNGSDDQNPIIKKNDYKFCRNLEKFLEEVGRGNICSYYNILLIFDTYEIKKRNVTGGSIEKCYTYVNEEFCAELYRFNTITN